MRNIPDACRFTFQLERNQIMSEPRDDKARGESIPDPTARPRPPEMDLEPIPMPDPSGPDTDDPLVDKGLVPPVPSPDEANIDPDEALPDDAEEEILEDDPGREKTRFDEELPKTSR